MPTLELSPSEAAALLEAASAYRLTGNAFLHSAGEKLRDVVARDETQRELAAIRSGGAVPLDVALTFVIGRYVYVTKHQAHFDLVHEMVFRGIDLDANDALSQASERICRAFPSLSHETAADLDRMICVHSVLCRSQCRLCVRDYLVEKASQFGAAVHSNLLALGSSD